MIRGVYDAATGMTEALINQEVIANNLANANTAGYRRQGYVFGSFQAALNQAATNNTQVSDVIAGGYTGFEPGPVQNTGNPLDLAITGDGYFVVDGPGGQLYTRNGSFDLNAQGQLQTKSGYLVRGEGGAIAIPPETANITVTLEGVVLADNNQVGRLQLARFPNPNNLRRMGDTLFQGPPAPAQQELGNVRVEQGYREGSNVDVVREMIGMLAGLRQYEAAERGLRSLAEATALNTRPQA